MELFCGGRSYTSCGDVHCANCEAWTSIKCRDKSNATCRAFSWAKCRARPCMTCRDMYYANCGAWPFTKCIDEPNTTCGAMPCNRALPHTSRPSLCITLGTFSPSRRLPSARASEPLEPASSFSWALPWEKRTWDEPSHNWNTHGKIYSGDENACPPHYTLTILPRSVWFLKPYAELHTIRSH